MKTMEKNKNKKEEIDKFNLAREANIEVGQLPRRRKAQIPGYLSVKIDNYELEDDEIKFFGVKKQGAPISGKGVEASRIETEEEDKIVYFNMDELIETGQYTENTVEGVITVNNQEIGREAVKNADSAIYLG